MTLNDYKNALSFLITGRWNQTAQEAQVLLQLVGKLKEHIDQLEKEDQSDRDFAKDNNPGRDTREEEESDT